MITTNGAISLDELLKMPLKQYVALRKAIEIVELEKRKTYVLDTSMAFSDPNKIIKGIDDQLRELNKRSSKVSWNSDKASIERAKKKYMR